MKVSELQGALLDYWVGRATQMDVKLDGDGTIQNRQVCWSSVNPWNGADMPSCDRYSPSAWWTHGGPVIERHRIMVTWVSGDTDDDVLWHATADEYATVHCAESPLVAAMRSLVASRYGEEVPEYSN
jgi:hypothetical protein